MSYLLGDSEAAASRLRLLSEVFAPSTAAFLTEAVKSPPQLVLDLGCGPGHTTRLLAETLRPRLTVGIDGSERFIGQARAEAPEGVTFRQHDVTRLPLPAAPADVIYCRFLLTHLPDPLSVAGRWWRRGLKPGGMLLMEELEEIVTGDPVFQEYLSMVTDALSHQHSQLFVGRALAEMKPEPEAVVEISRVSEIMIPRDVAARMFYMNLPALREKVFIRENYGDSLAGLEAELGRLAEGPVGEAEPVRWRLRQMAVRRAPAPPG